MTRDTQYSKLEMADIGTLTEWAHRFTTSRKYDMYLGSEADPQMLRWYVLPRNPFFNIYIHRFLRSDDDRALHDHPADNATLILEGEYWEHLPGGMVMHRQPGWIYQRIAETPHRVELRTGPCLTLFQVGLRRREWGFHCPRGWMHWREFQEHGDCW